MLEKSTLWRISSGVATQGQSLLDNWVEEYKLQFSNNNTAWEQYKADGNVKVACCE